MCKSIIRDCKKCEYFRLTAFNDMVTGKPFEYCRAKEQFIVGTKLSALLCVCYRKKGGAE